MRRLIERDLRDIETALDLLAVALAEHGHLWSATERHRYQRAVSLVRETPGRKVRRDAGQPPADLVTAAEERLCAS